MSVCPEIEHFQLKRGVPGMGLADAIAADEICFRIAFDLESVFVNSCTSGDDDDDDDDDEGEEGAGVEGELRRGDEVMNDDDGDDETCATRDGVEEYGRARDNGCLVWIY